jgi:hypothetical protein
VDLDDAAGKTRCLVILQNNIVAAPQLHRSSVASAAVAPKKSDTPTSSAVWRHSSAGFDHKGTSLGILIVCVTNAQHCGST